MIAKRVFDLLVAGVALLLMWPFLLLIAVAIRADSPGSALFRQERVGRRGVPFRILKFRTMFDARSAAGSAMTTGSAITVAGDPRITRLGRLLRRSKLDEFPQLINVVKGEMSLVGPRPEVPGYVALYPAELREVVLSLRPGITDLAAIEFVDEETLLSRAADPEHEYITNVMPRKLRLYERYARSCSFWGDIAIIWRTLTTVLTRR